MYIPKSFNQDNLTELHELMQQYNFATLVTTGTEELPFATHVPLMLDAKRGKYGTLVGHVARANPQWRSFEHGTVLVIFQGPHSYISPSWYEIEPSVPTWNYAIVHAYGKVRLLNDFETMQAMLQGLVQKHEDQFEQPWPMDLPQDYLNKMMLAIVGFEIEITSLEGKFKLSQNRSATDQKQVAAALHGQAEPLAQHVAAMMDKIQQQS